MYWIFSLRYLGTNVFILTYFYINWLIWLLAIKIKVSYFASKNGLIQDKYAVVKAIGKFNKQKKGSYFIEEKEEIGRSRFEQKFFGEKQEFRRRVVSLAELQGCSVSRFLVGDAIYIFSVGTSNCWFFPFDDFLYWDL